MERHLGCIDCISSASRLFIFVKAAYSPDRQMCVADRHKLFNLYERKMLLYKKIPSSSLGIPN